MAIVKPQVLVFQEYSIVPNSLVEPLRAHISGANAVLHRYSVAAEKALIALGEYSSTSETCYTWPGRAAGGIVDETSVKLYLDDALLRYYNSLTQSGGTITQVVGRDNWLRASGLAFISNGTTYPRSTYFYDRDVAVGDRVRVWGTGSGGEAGELWSYVYGFASDESEGTVGVPYLEDSNADDTVEAGTAVSSVVADNTYWAIGTSSTYNGLSVGRVEEVYTITITEEPTYVSDGLGFRTYAANGTASVTSASGLDDVAEVIISPMSHGSGVLDFELQIEAGTLGAIATFSDTSLLDPPEYPTLTVGTTITVTVAQDFIAPAIDVDGTYTGELDDTYIVTVTKGGLWSESPQITVTTARGADFSGPTTVTDPATASIALGTNGLTFRFVEVAEYDSLGSYDSTAYDQLLGLNYGDKFYVDVVSGADGYYRTLILRNNLPDELDGASNLNLQLFMEKDILITEEQEPNPPAVNYELEATQICVQSGIQVYDSSWTNSGVQVALPVVGGDLYVEYNEWVPTVADDVYFASSTADLDDIPGQLDPANELKWGVYKALQNSNGTSVGYTAVANPLSTESWQAVLDRVDGRADVYNIVPMTKDTVIKGLYQGLVENNSGAEQGAWKATFFCLNSISEKMLVGESSAADQILNPTSTDGEAVLAIVEDDPTATGTQYTLLSVPEDNSNFITYGVRAGDTVRYLFTVDGFGNEDYEEFTVDQVLSENSLLLTAGTTVPVAVPQRIEIWRTLTAGELITELSSESGSYADKRVCMVWPDYVGSGGTTMEGYFVCAALAGLVSGVSPHQGLTNVEISGFDDYTRSYKLFSESQMTTLANAGVWITTQDGNGTAHTRHALTTDVSSTNTQEEMIRRNVDSISYIFLNRLAPYIGRTNVTPSMLKKLRYEVEATISYLRNTGYTSELGGQLIDATITTLRVHPLLADRVEIVLDLEVPYPLNNIEVHLVV